MLCSDLEGISAESVPEGKKLLAECVTKTKHKEKSLKVAEPVAKRKCEERSVFSEHAARKLVEEFKCTEDVFTTE